MSDVHKYQISIMDPFGAIVASMFFSSFAPDDPSEDWFTQIFGTANSAMATFRNMSDDQRALMYVTISKVG